MAFLLLSRYDKDVNGMIPFLSRIASWGIIMSVFILLGIEPPNTLPDEKKSGKKDPSKILREIYEEVKELGKFPGDDFIKREFFVGKDDDDTYQDIHALVLIQNINGIEKITIQVTYFKPSEKDPTIKYAEDMKILSYAVLRQEIAILKSDYSEKEQKKFLPQVIRAIRGKKRLLKRSRLSTQEWH
jgi:hypothetical protein